MINPHVTALNKSATLKITALTKKLIREGKDVVNFAGGEPDFDAPQDVKEAVKAAVDAGFSKYTPSCGLPELRAAIAAKLSNQNKIATKPEEVIVTSGAKYAIYVALLTLCKAGDEVIIPSPHWVSYPEMVQLIGAKAKFLPTAESNNFKIDPKALKEAVTSQTKVLILNYPSNPTGATYSKEELEAIYEAIKDKNIFVISDEIYEVLSYDSHQHVSFASFPQSAKRTITINGFSKAYSMTGWRLGYLAGSESIISQASKIIDHTTSCACVLSQKGAIAALKNDAWLKKVHDTFTERRDLFYQGLSECKQLKPMKPQGTFYLFCDIRPTGLGSFDFATKLLEQELVSCIPADPFGMPGFLRMSFATSNEQISKGIERIKKFLSDL